MPEEATRPIGAVPAHQRKELRIVTKFHKRGKSGIPKETAIIVRCIAKPTGNVLLFGLAKQETIPNPSTTFCLVPSGETRQEVGESHKYQKKVVSENLFVCKDQWPLSLAKLAKRHYGNAGWGQSSYATGEGPAESNQPAQNPKKKILQQT